MYKTIELVTAQEYKRYPSFYKKAYIQSIIRLLREEGKKHTFREISELLNTKDFKSVRDKCFTEQIIYYMNKELKNQYRNKK